MLAPDEFSMRRARGSAFQLSWPQALRTMY
jgi:hypothetical protein